MTQNLKVTITIPIPSDSVLISKVELEELKKNELTGVYWTMKDLEKRINRSDDWIKENILLRPVYKKILNVENGGCVFYPESRGQPWVFQAVNMAAFLDKYFPQIFTKKG